MRVFGSHRRRGRLWSGTTGLARRARSSANSRASHKGQTGFTLIELVVTIALLSVVMAISSTVIIGVLTDTQAESLTITGLQQSELAGKVFTQYLRSAVALINIQPNDLTFSAYTGSLNGVPQVDTIEAELCTTKSPLTDQFEVFFGLPSTGTGSSGIHTCSQGGGTTTTSSIPAGVRLVQAFDVKPPTATDIFHYYQVNGTALTSIPTATARANPATVQAVGVSLTFVPPPGPAAQGYHDVLGTTVQTVTFLRN